MSQTITALGTVPQSILDIGPALTTSYTVQATFDTHGAEYIGFQMTYTKGGETSVQMSFEVQLRTTGEWVALPVVQNSLIQTSDAASTSRAFQLYVGRATSSMRIRAKTVGAANGTTRVQLSGMLSGPTYPIIGQAF